MGAAPADPTSLDNLYDIVMPLPVPWWPLAPGWYMVGGVVLAELQRLQARTADDAQREFALQELPELVKRAALAAFPRQQVASLSGASWLEFLDHTGHTNAFTHGQGKRLPALAYDPHTAGRLDAHDAGALCNIISRWIRGHSALLKRL